SAIFYAAGSEQSAFVLFGPPQLGDSLKREKAEERRAPAELDHSSTAAKYAEKPGPNAASKGGPRAPLWIACSRTNNTVADDMLPKRRSPSQEWRSWWRVSPSTSSMVSSNLRPPGGKRKPLKSASASPLRSRKSLSAGASAFFISDGNSGLSTMPKPSSFMSHPMMCSVFPQHHSPLARMRGPARERLLVLCSNKPAAPSPNKAGETNIAGLGSLTRRHRLQRSTVRNKTSAPSLA